MISPERWALIEPILDAALDLPEEEVDEYLDEACGSDAELRAEVETLLRAGKSRDDLLEHGVGALGGPLLHAAAGAGDSVGRYRLLRRLGEGGMGVVWLARDPRLERDVALKMLPPWLARDENYKARFTREARAASALDHPNIGTVHEIAETDSGDMYIVMAHYGGGTLAERIAGGPLRVAEAIEIGVQLADALRAAHEKGIVHRDVKPSNVILTPDGLPKLVDFGIARRGADSVTATGVVQGTASYMSPEQSWGEGVDGRTDIWSLGVVLFEMLAGERPFTADGSQATIACIRSEEPPPLAEVRSEIPEHLAAVVRRCLQKDRGERYASAAELRDALAALPGTSPSPVAAARGRPAGKRVWRWRWVGAAATVGIALVTALLLRPDRPDGPVTPDAEAILVLPLAPAVPDTSLVRLGRELAVTLSANLGSVPGVETIEALTVLAQLGSDSVPGLEGGAELARRLGARSVLVGTLVRSGGEVRADLALHEVGELEPLARVRVTAPPADMAALTDSVTFAILREVWRRGEAPVPSLAGLTTGSVEALRAYLEGEQALARSEYDDAVSAFERAYAADSTFHFALWRSLYPRVYEGTRLDTARNREMIEHRGDFPTPDRLLLESSLETTVGQALSARRGLTAEYPTYWPGWYSLADMLVHATPYLGTTIDEARAALERTVELNPGFASAWEHLLWAGVYQRDTALAVRALDELERFGGPGAFKVNPDLLRYYGVVVHVLRNGGVFEAERLAREADFIASYAGGVPDLLFGQGLLDFDFPKAQVQLAEAVLERGPRRGVEAAMWLGKGLGLAGRGAWEPALVAMDRWVGLSTGGSADEAPDAGLVTYGLAVAAVRVGGLSPEAASGRRGPAVAAPAASTADGRADLAWLDGLLAHATGDSSGVVEARRAVQESGSRFSAWLDRSLAAFERELSGEEGLAGEALAQLEMESAETREHEAYGWSHPFFNALNRTTAVSWLLASGDTVRAERLLSWHEAEQSSDQRFLDVINTVVAPVALLERARLEAARGDSIRAARDYREFVLRYDLASGEYSAGREEAIATLRALPAN